LVILVLTQSGFAKSNFIFRLAIHHARRRSRAGRGEVSPRVGHFIAANLNKRNRKPNKRVLNLPGLGYPGRRTKMLRKSMIALCTVASIAALTPDLALARGGGGGGGGHGGGGGGFGGGHAGGFGGGGFAGRGFGGGGNFGGSFARGAAVGAVAGVGAAQGGRFANGGFNHGGFNHGRFDHGRRFFAGGFGGYYDGYWDYPDYAYDDSYYDNGGYDDGGCYVVQRRVHTSYGWRVRPVQVCG
jgi:hypothetical protein